MMKRLEPSGKMDLALGKFLKKIKGQNQKKRNKTPFDNKYLRKYGEYYI